MPVTTDELLAELDALDVPAPMPPLTSLVTLLGGAAVGFAVVSLVNGHAVYAPVALSVAAMLLTPMIRLRQRGRRFRRELRRIRETYLQPGTVVLGDYEAISARLDSMLARAEGRD